MTGERVRHRWGGELGTVVMWFERAVIVRWDAQLNETPPRSGEYRRMELQDIVPEPVSDPAEDRAYRESLAALRA